MSLKIKYIELQNWQSYSRAKIPLTPFTILVGQSRAGKTSVFRAIEFLLYGDFDPTFPNDPAKAVCVAIELDNGTRIIRIRKANGENQAAIIRNDATVKYKSFGAIIPGINALINAKPIEVGTKSINLNISSQDDAPFMVAEARPVKAQFIGRLYGAHVVNQMLRAMAKDKKNTDIRRKDAEERLKSIETEIKAYETVPEQEAVLGQVEALLVAYRALKQCQQDASILKVNVDSYNRDKWVSKANTTEIRVLLEQLQLLRFIQGEYSKLLADKAELDIMLRAKKIDAKALRRNVVALAHLRDLWTNLAKGIEMAENKAKVVAALVRKQHDLSDTLLAGNLCPACGQAIAADTGTHVGVIGNIARLVGGQVNAD